MSSQSFMAAQAEGLCLRHPEDFPPNVVTIQTAVQLLRGSLKVASETAFVWGYLDQPRDTSIYLLFLPQGTPNPKDGVRWLAQRDILQRIPLENGMELEVAETKYGMVPNSGEAMASRVRRRFRLTRGGNPNLVVMNYTRGDSIPVPPAANTPIRSYPLPPITQPPAFVMGPRSPFKDQPYQPHSPSSANIPSPLGAGLGMGGGGGGMSQQAAMIAQQNSNMEMLERRREREREMRPPGHIPPPGPMPRQPRPEEDDSGDEADISTRTLALTRYRRNHELMNAVFHEAAFGEKKEDAHATPYSIFDREELQKQADTLLAEIEALQVRGEERKASRARSARTEDISMTV